MGSSGTKTGARDRDRDRVGRAGANKQTKATTAGAACVRPVQARPREGRPAIKIQYNPGRAIDNLSVSQSASQSVNRSGSQRDQQKKKKRKSQINFSDCSLFTRRWCGHVTALQPVPGHTPRVRIFSAFCTPRRPLL